MSVRKRLLVVQRGSLECNPKGLECNLDGLGYYWNRSMWLHYGDVWFYDMC